MPKGENMMSPSIETAMAVESEAAGGASYNRRREARIEDCHHCDYQLCDFREDGTVAIGEGQLVTVNRSAHGILLMMREAPRVRQLIEVHNRKLGWLRSMMVYQVRWTRPLQVESGEPLFLVGCRLTVGLSPGGHLQRAGYSEPVR